MFLMGWTPAKSSAGDVADLLLKQAGKFLPKGAEKVAGIGKVGGIKSRRG